MKTSQSFSFYPTDFLMGTMLMSPAEVGSYIRLLCYQWQEGSLPPQKDMLCRLALCDESTLEGVMKKFQADASGALKNPRLEEVRKSVLAYKKSRSKNGKLGGRTKKHVESICFNESEKTKKHSSSLPSPSPIPLPYPSPQFAEAWDKWSNHRKEIKKPLTKTSTEQQLKQMESIGEERAIRMIEHSIQNGWQGLFEPEKKTGDRPFQLSNGYQQPSSCL